jgi:hypothetical protein
MSSNIILTTLYQSFKNLILTTKEKDFILSRFPNSYQFIKRYLGSKEIINGGGRWCIWIENQELQSALDIQPIRERIEKVGVFRVNSRGQQANNDATTPHRFVFTPHSNEAAIAIPNVSSERREYLPCEITSGFTVVSNWLGV